MSPGTPRLHGSQMHGASLEREAAAPEAQPEAVASRVLWLIGYHQPILYFSSGVAPERRRSSAALDSDFVSSRNHVSIGAWSWTDNPFVAGRRELNGLVAVDPPCEQLGLQNQQQPALIRPVLSRTGAVGS